MSGKKTKKSERHAPAAESVGPLAPVAKDAEKVAPRDWPNDPAWLRYLINEMLAVLPSEIEFRADADPERCARLLGFLEHVKEEVAVEDQDEEESE